MVTITSAGSPKKSQNSEMGPSPKNAELSFIPNMSGTFSRNLLKREILALRTRENNLTSAPDHSHNFRTLQSQSAPRIFTGFEETQTRSSVPRFVSLACVHVSAATSAELTIPVARPLAAPALTLDTG